MTPEQITKLRHKLHLSQQEFADKLGTYQEVVTKWETGKVMISQAYVKLIGILFPQEEDKLEQPREETG